MTPNRRLSSTTLATLTLLMCTVVWGSTFILIKDVVTRIPVADFLGVRFAVAAAAMLLVSPRAALRLQPQQRRQGVILGLLYGAAQILQTAGLQHTSASVSGFLTGLYVVFTPLLAGLLLRQHIGRAAWAAVVMATAGLALLSLHGMTLGSGETLTIMCAVLYALHILGLGRWSTSASAYGLSVVQMFVIAAVCLVAGLPGGITLPSDLRAWLAIGYTAVFAGVLALVGQTWAQSQLSPTRAAIVMTTEPLFASIFAVAFSSESVTGRLLLGGGLVLAAMALTEIGPRKGADARVSHLSAP